MSGLTKKRHTKRKSLSPDISLRIGTENHDFSTMSELLAFVQTLLSPQPKQDSIPWRESKSFKNGLEFIGGEKAYRESAMMVRGARTREGMTQVELSEKLGVKQHNLSMIENAKRPVGKDLAKRLAKVFNSNYKVFISDLPD